MQDLAHLRANKSCCIYVINFFVVQPHLGPILLQIIINIFIYENFNIITCMAGREFENMEHLRDNIQPPPPSRPTPVMEWPVLI